MNIKWERSSDGYGTEELIITYARRHAYIYIVHYEV